MFSYSSQGQESNGYFQEKKLPTQLYVTKEEEEKTKTIRLFPKFVLSHQVHKMPISTMSARSPKIDFTM